MFRLELLLRHYCTLSGFSLIGLRSLRFFVTFFRYFVFLRKFFENGYNYKKSYNSNLFTILSTTNSLPPMCPSLQLISNMQINHHQNKTKPTKNSTRLIMTHASRKLLTFNFLTTGS